MSGHSFSPLLSSYTHCHYCGTAVEMTTFCFLLCIHPCHPLFSHSAVPSWPARSAHRQLAAPASRSDNLSGGLRGQAAGHTRTPERLPRAQETTDHTQSSGPQTKRRRRRKRARPEAVSSSSGPASPGNDASPVQEIRKEKS